MVELERGLEAAYWNMSGLPSSAVDDGMQKNLKAAAGGGDGDGASCEAT